MGGCSMEQVAKCEEKFEDLYQLVDELTVLIADLKAASETNMTFKEFWPWAKKIEEQYISLLEEVRDVKLSSNKEISLMNEKLNTFTVIINEKITSLYNVLDVKGNLLEKIVDELSSQMNSFIEINTKSIEQNTEQINKIFFKLYEEKCEDVREAKKVSPWISWLKDKAYRIPILTSISIAFVFVVTIIVWQWDDINNMIISIWGNK